VITLFDKPECPFCYRVRLALGALGVEHRCLDHVEHPEWHDLTPAKTVPVFVEDDVVLTDSQVILEFLQDAHGGLLPEGPGARAEVRALVQYADNPVGRAVREVVFEKRAGPEAGWDRERIAKGAAGWRDCLPALEARVGREGFLQGDAYTMADAAMTSRFALAEAYGLPLPEGLPRLTAWWAARRAESFFAGASPPRVRAWLRSTAA
jgi:glutathione S-transferase